jgi:Lrp/AsnC family transcriptional regulator for asnA, asnC and gidA
MSMVDGLDSEIIRDLEEDGRKPFTEIARELNVSEATVRKRVLAMQNNGVIKKFTVKLDASKLGLNTLAIVGVDVDPTKLLVVAQKLCSLKEAKCVATSSGDHMVMLEIWTKDGRELASLIAGQIENMEGVKKICPALILEKLKE